MFVKKNVKYDGLFVQKSVYLVYGKIALQGIVGMEGL